MIKLESFMKDGKIPSYNLMWSEAIKRLRSLIASPDYDVESWPPADDGGDDFKAALDNVVWLNDMAYMGDSLDEVEYRQWWVDFIISIETHADATTLRYPEGGCDGEIRFDYINEMASELG